MSSYQTLTPADTQAFSEFLSHNGQMLLPMVQLIEQSRGALDDVIDVTGRAMIEMILQVSADTLAGAKSPGKKRGEIRHHGTQDGVVHLKERKLRVRRPRLRHRTDGEVDIPAYESLRTRPRMAQRMMQIMIDGVSTRRYKDVIPRMAESVGISKSAVSRANIEAGEVSPSASTSATPERLKTRQHFPNLYTASPYLSSSIDSRLFLHSGRGGGLPRPLLEGR